MSTDLCHAMYSSNFCKGPVNYGIISISLGPRTVFYAIRYMDTVGRSLDTETGRSWRHKLLLRFYSFTIDRWVFMWTIVILHNLPPLPRKIQKGLAIQWAVEKQLPESISVDPHFTPHYKLRDQRLCFAPQGDFFENLRAGRLSWKLVVSSP